MLTSQGLSTVCEALSLRTSSQFYSLPRYQFRCCALRAALYTRLGILESCSSLSIHHPLLCVLVQCLPSSIAIKRYKSCEYVCLVHHCIPSSYSRAWYIAGIKQIYIKWMNCVVLNIKIKYWSKQKSGHYLHQSFHFISGNSWAAQDNIIQLNWYPGSIKLSKDFYESFFPNKEKLDAQMGNIQLKKKIQDWSFFSTHFLFFYSFPSFFF